MGASAKPGPQRNWPLRAGKNQPRRAVDRSRPAVPTPENPPAARPYKGRPEADSSQAGGDHGGTLPHSRQGSPKVSPRTPLPYPIPAQPWRQRRRRSPHSEERDASTDRQPR